MITIQATADLMEKYFAKTAQYTIRAPGRVNLIGEHTDYNDGFVLPCAIDFATQVSIAPREDDQISVLAADYGNAQDSFSARQRPDKSDKHWGQYVRGVVDVFMQRFGALPHGFDMVISGNVPQGAGLSSSASLEVAIGKALQALYRLPVDEKQIALLGQQAENEFVGCRCGIMDQFISALGEAGHALLIDCRTLDTQSAAIPEDMRVLIINSKVQRGLVDSEYNTRRAQCEAAAAHFGVSALRDVSLTQLQAEEGRMDDVVYRRARHVVSENARTLAAVSALQSGDMARLSALMAQSHASMRDDFEITVPPIDALVAIVAEVIGDQGGVRMTGGGFGGCVVALLPAHLVEAACEAVQVQYPQQTGLQAEMYICRAREGVHVL